MVMPMARLAQYQHCLLRSNGTRTHWCGSGEGGIGLREQMENLLQTVQIKAEQAAPHGTARLVRFGISDWRVRQPSSLGLAAGTGPETAPRVAAIRSWSWFPTPSSGR